MKRAQSATIRKPYYEKPNEWKPKKVKEPDVGSYEVLKSTGFVKTHHPVISFPKSKSLKFTVEYSQNKKHIPGAP